jgi:hypothetical protein
LPSIAAQSASNTAMSAAAPGRPAGRRRRGDLGLWVEAREQAPRPARVPSDRLSYHVWGSRRTVTAETPVADRFRPHFRTAFTPHRAPPTSILSFSLS